MAAAKIKTLALFIPSGTMLQQVIKINPLVCNQSQNEISSLFGDLALSCGEWN
jgi:hypothetical protein